MCNITAQAPVANATHLIPKDVPRTAGRWLTPPPLDLALHVRELLGDFAVGDAEHVDASYGVGVGAVDIEHVPPTRSAPVAGNDDLFGFQPSSRCPAEELIPASTD